MAKEPSKKSQMKIATRSNPNVADQIRHRAYELYEARGRQDGRDWEDWFRAEEELTPSKARAVTAH